MFACPHCQFENPLENRFCQRCGNPLKGLWAIVARTHPAAGISSDEQRGQDGQPDPGYANVTVEPQPAAPSFTETGLQIGLVDGTYLDTQKRYQVREAFEQKPGFWDEFEFSIIDCQPANLSPINRLLEAETTHPEATPLMAALPDKAYPYWQLQDKFFPVIPELQAAWQESGYTILILEDRSTWRSLSEVLRSTPVEPVEVIHWFYEIVDLWETLITFEAEPSLLNQQNLLIDDDQILCLKRLLYRSGDRSYDIQDLGLTWQSLLQQAAVAQFAPLESVAAEITAGALQETAAIKERLAVLADTLQGLDDALPPPTALKLPTDEAEAELPADEVEAELPNDEADGEDTSPWLVDDLLLREDDTEDDESSPSEEAIGDLPTMALPMKLYRLDEVGRTHVGRQRAHNEDFFYAETELRRTDSPSGPSLSARGLYILCDGMGGHAGGEVASALAVSTLRDYFHTHWKCDLPDKETIEAGILQANQVIFEKNEAEERTGNARMGTTLVMVLLADNQAVVAHVGDSRLYYLNRQGLKQATVDHEVGQREIKRGVEPAIAYARPDAYQLTQALGPRSNAEVSPNITTLHISQDTLFLLCSDGLSDNDLLETHIESHIEPLLRSRSDLEEGIASLIDLANEHNGHDNITAVAIRVKVRPNLEAIQNRPIG